MIFIEAGAWTVIVRILQGWFSGNRHSYDLGQHGSAREEDEDVASERARIERMVGTGEGTPKFVKESSPRPKGKDAIVVKDLRKDYPLGVFSSLGFGRSFRAVDSLTFGIPTGQCFGLLGINGAGDCIA